jgi:hypothetical protein
MGTDPSQRRRAAGGEGLSTEPQAPAPKTYTWQMSREEGKTVVYCWPSSRGGQYLMKLWETDETTPFHDERLQRCTREINAILERVAKRNQDPDRVLSFIEYRNRLLLVWARYGVVGPEDSDETVADALKLRLDA